MLNGAAIIHAVLNPFVPFVIVSVGHVVENARLVDVDGGATVACRQAVSFIVVHGIGARTFLLPSDPPQYQSMHCIHCGENAVGETGARHESIPNPLF